jgi:hypothetical protein
VGLSLSSTRKPAMPTPHQPASPAHLTPANALHEALALQPQAEAIDEWALGFESAMPFFMPLQSDDGGRTAFNPLRHP